MEDTLTVGSVIANLVLIVLLIFRYVAPYLAKWVGNFLDRSSSRSGHNLEIDKAEDQLSIQSKEFLTDIARQNISSARKLADECQIKLEEANERIQTLMIERAQHKSKENIRVHAINQIIEDVYVMKQDIQSILKAIQYISNHSRKSDVTRQTIIDIARYIKYLQSLVKKKNDAKSLKRLLRENQKLKSELIKARSIISDYKNAKG